METTARLPGEKYREILESAIELDDNGQGCRLDDVGSTGSHISKLKAEGLVETVIESSNRANWYRLTDREEVQAMLDEIDEELESPDSAGRYDWDFDPPQIAIAPISF